MQQFGRALRIHLLRPMPCLLFGLHIGYVAPAFEKMLQSLPNDLTDVQQRTPA